LGYYDGAYDKNASVISSETQTANACERRIILGTLDNRVIEIDANNGNRCTDFGQNGEVSILENMGETYKGYVAITSGPVVVRDTVIVGHQVVDGQRAFGPPGVVKAFNVKTGELKWAWDAAALTTPNPVLATMPINEGRLTSGRPSMATTSWGWSSCQWQTLRATTTAVPAPRKS